METMTPKERIDAVIKHQAVDRTPFTVVDGGAWMPHQAALWSGHVTVLVPP